MRRGFKAEAERLATTVREQTGLGLHSPLDVGVLASHVRAQLRSAEELTSIAKLRDLESLQPGAFSACTFDFGARKVIVFSPLASTERQRSDVSHEASHLLLKHNVKDVKELGGVSFFSCDPDEEQEANWLAGCLLLPRALLLRCRQRGMEVSDIAAAHTVSLQMTNFRLRTTGVDRQATRRHP